MKTSDGFYAYYSTEKATRPILCELMAGYVCECGNEGWVPLSMYPGRFVPLVEQPQIEPVADKEMPRL